MGRVYLARTAAGRRVAVKTIRPGLAAEPRFRERFRSEIAAMRRVGGFHTAPVVDADPDADPPWLATAYIPGPSLQDAVVAHGPLPEPSLRLLGAGLAEALMEIHRNGLVHRDLKPSNVLLLEDGPRVIDFGIARDLTGTSLTATGAVLGTLGYLAPEQARGEQVGPAADVFALGALLAFAGGAQGFGTGPAEAMLYRVIHTEPDLDGLPASLRPLVADCLAKDPRRRPEVGAILHRLTGEAGAPDPGTAWLPGPTLTMVREFPTTPTAPAAPPGASGPTGPTGAGAPAASGSVQVLDLERGRAPVIVPLGGLLDARGGAVVLRYAKPRRPHWGLAMFIAMLAACGILVAAGHEGLIALGLLLFSFPFLAAWIQARQASPPDTVRIDSEGMYVLRGGAWYLIRWPMVRRVRPVSGKGGFDLELGLKYELPLIIQVIRRFGVSVDGLGTQAAVRTLRICPYGRDGFDAPEMRAALHRFAPDGVLDATI
ncbi:serine/threonine protein kinase [Actinomadura sp. LCR2-06]|uniref:Serine/threonine protein kinase n=2 Tax=Actinomadura violacea TaxID=2819934 RepID=A0ABS3RMM5_9ACTN|nr:serine/threonine protein kinase [Actinomadura violacea]